MMNATSEILNDRDALGLHCTHCGEESLGTMTAVSVVTERWINDAETQPSSSFADHHFCDDCTALFNFPALQVPLTEAATSPESEYGDVTRAAPPVNAGEAMAHCIQCNDAVYVGDTMTSVSVEDWSDPYITGPIEVYSTHQFCMHCTPRFNFTALRVPPVSVLTAQA